MLAHDEEIHVWLSEDGAPPKFTVQIKRHLNLCLCGTGFPSADAAFKAAMEWLRKREEA